MVRTSRLVAVGVAEAIINFIAQPAIFPPSPELQRVIFESSLLPHFIFFGVWDAVAFGFGVALLVYGAVNYHEWGEGIRRPLLQVLFVALWFSILNWVHNGLHVTMVWDVFQERVALQAGVNTIMLLGIEYSFHFPWLILASLLILSVRQLTRLHPRIGQSPSSNRGTVIYTPVVAGLAAINLPINLLVFKAEDAFPPASVAPYFSFMNLWDSVAFGMGVALLAWILVSYSKWTPTVRAPLLLILFVALWFTLLNWIHNGLHTVTELGLAQEVLNGRVGPYALIFLGIDYSFHVPWLVFSTLLFIAVRRIVRAFPAQQR